MEDAWMSGWMDGWMSQWIEDGHVGRWVDEQMDRWTGGWIDGCGLPLSRADFLSLLITPGPS
jgi:hypothetical protein